MPAYETVAPEVMRGTDGMGSGSRSLGGHTYENGAIELPASYAPVRGPQEGRDG